MADTHEEAAELRISRVKALDEQNLVGLVTYLLARYPGTFPEMLDDALSSHRTQGGLAGQRQFHSGARFSTKARLASAESSKASSRWV